MADLMVNVADGVIVRPGDTLVVRVRDFSTEAEAAEWRQMLEDLLPGVKAIIVCADELVVHRQQEEQPT